MSSPVDFYFDFSSPYAYFAITKIDELVAEFDRDVVWHPFMLGPAFKMTDNAPLPGWRWETGPAWTRAVS